jgi:uncharacterized protein HemX
MKNQKITKKRNEVGTGGGAVAALLCAAVILAGIIYLYIQTGNF